jgi:hypothetical protein
MILTCVGMSLSSPFTKQLEKAGYSEVIDLKEIPAALQGPIIGTPLDPPVNYQQYGIFGGHSIEFWHVPYETLQIACGFKPNKGEPLRCYFVGTSEYLLIIFHNDPSLTALGRYLVQVVPLGPGSSYQFFMK